MYRFNYNVCFDDVDAAGIVYYPRFLHFCHLAFEAFFNEKGPMTYPELIYKRKVGLPIVKVAADYKQPLSYGSHLVIEIGLKAIKSSSSIFLYRIFNQEKIECFTAEITTVCVDLEQKKSFPLPDDFREFFDAFKILS